MNRGPNRVVQQSMFLLSCFFDLSCVIYQLSALAVTGQIHEDVVMGNLILTYLQLNLEASSINIFPSSGLDWMYLCGACSRALRCLTYMATYMKTHHISASATDLLGTIEAEFCVALDNYAFMHMRLGCSKLSIRSLRLYLEEVHCSHDGNILSNVV